MKLLALDTSTEFLSLALWQDGAVLTRELLAGQRHAEIILPLLDELLVEAGLPLAAMDGIVFGAGPGSFTGLRIGCGVAQGLAMGSGLPVLGVCTLQALAWQADADRVIACLDARMDEVYHAAFERCNGVWHSVLPPGLYPPAQVPALEGGGWCAIGSGWDVFGVELDAVYGVQVTKKIAGVFPLARHMAELAAPGLARGDGVAARLAAPVYVRDRVALTMKERAARK